MARPPDSIVLMKSTTAPESPVGSTPPRLFARLPTVLAATGLGRSTVYRLIAAGAFPAPVRLGPRAVGWRWSDLDALI
jgi:prophage regulatory protein